MDKSITDRPAKGGRLTREDWLAKAMDVLARKGSTELRVDALARSLGVTKGSFYWHFKDRNEFMRSLLDYWLQAFTTNVIEKIDTVEGSAEERLLALMQFVSDEGSARFDLAIRAWAVRESEMDKLVQKVDRQRLNYIRSLFSEMGFRGGELEMRTQTFVVYQSFEPTLLSHLEQSEEERQELLKQRHAFFTRR